MKTLKELIEVEKAVEILTDKLKTIQYEEENLPLWMALGRILNEDVVALHDLPDVDRSAVDGFAVIAEDTYHATHYNPVELKLVKQLEKGKCIERGEAFEVHTGWSIPCGANSVVMKEDVIAGEKTIHVLKPASVGGNVSRRGEDYAKGSVIARRGTILGPFHLAILSSNGVGSVKVLRKIKVGIIATGDEIIRPGFKRREGAYFDSSGILIQMLLANDGFYDVKYYGVFPDDVKLVSEVLNEATLVNDIVLTVGGTGVSNSDVTVEAAEDLGEILFRGVRMRPGRPTSASLVNGRLVLHLSGYPVAAWTGYEMLLRRAVAQALGLVNYDRKFTYARLSKRLPNQVGYHTIIRARLNEVNGEILAEPYMIRGSGVLTSLVFSQGFIEIPSYVEGFEKGDVVKVFLF
ncbi:MAG: molybdopterin molybdotransferase MoeA [Thermosphaera sp.]